MVTRLLGIAFVSVGLLMALFFMFVFDTTETYQGTEIPDLELLTDGQKGTVLGIGLANLGGLFLVVGTLESRGAESAKSRPD